MVIDLNSQPEIVRYLAELDGRLAVLPADYRAEVLDSITEHLAASLAAGTGVSAALAALGRPEDIAAGAVRESGAAPWPAAAPQAESVPQAGTAPQAETAPQPGTAPQAEPVGARVWLSVLALILLAVGGLIGPGLGWLAGVLLLWLSDRWSVAQKLTGCLAAPLFAAGVTAAGAVVALGDDLPGMTGFSPLDGIRPALLVQLVVVAWLAVRMRKGARA